MSEFLHERVLETVPGHLQSFVVNQNYARYTTQDQAVWRYIMHKNINFFRKHAHPSYITGLEKTGVSLDKSPDVQEMNQALDKIGWRAVVVNGFIPPAAFMEFQAHKILVISAEMRTIEHILYTPAPDIVHEAAGHAPIITDEKYSEYLHKFGEYGSKAMASKMDFEVYEAIRHLSILKEYPNSSDEEIKKAESDLNAKIDANNIPSEAALLSRLHWWTVEYGLIGLPQNFKQYGAGLLSSVGESEHCLNPEVKKIPLSLKCIDYNYDITTMQPQLFVAEDWQQLIDVLEEFADSMCFRKGGTSALRMAKESENVATVQYSSGLQVSGVLSELIADDKGDICYLQFSGPSALAADYRQLDGHGTDYHKDGFGSPVGKLVGTEKSLERFEKYDMDEYGLHPGNRTTITFDSGIEVQGVVADIKRNGKKIQLISFQDCRVKNNNGNILFRPEWGIYDMAVGSEISSVFAGTADKETYNVLPPKSDEIAIEIKYSDDQKQLFTLYQQVTDMRKSGLPDIGRLRKIEQELTTKYPKEWLLHLEIAELVKDVKNGSDLYNTCIKNLEQLKKHSDEFENLISEGLHLLSMKHERY
jgi:phenylalanine-4-hydroxylase